MHRENIKRLATLGFHILLWCLGISVLAENFLLYRQNQDLKAALSNQPQQIAAGAHLRNLSGITMDGRLSPIQLPSLGPDRLLIISFSPGCAACRENLNGWLKLAATLKAHPNWKVIWVSRDPVEVTSDYESKAGIPPSDVLSDPVNATYSQLSLRAVPNTIVVGADGIVEKVWRGELNAEGWHDVNRYFGLADEATATNAAPRTTKSGVQAP